MTGMLCYLDTLPNIDTCVINSNKDVRLVTVRLRRLVLG